MEKTIWDIKIAKHDIRHYLDKENLIFKFLLIWFYGEIDISPGGPVKGGDEGRWEKPEILRGAGGGF